MINKHLSFCAYIICIPPLIFKIRIHSDIHSLMFEILDYPVNGYGMYEYGSLESK